MKALKLWATVGLVMLALLIAFIAFHVIKLAVILIIVTAIVWFFTQQYFEYKDSENKD